MLYKLIALIFDFFCQFEKFPTHLIKKIIEKCSRINLDMIKVYAPLLLLFLYQPAIFQKACERPGAPLSWRPPL